MLTLVLGGTRSGKSTVAERIFECGMRGQIHLQHATPTYIATARADDGDAEMAARIAAHRDHRASSPVEWSTVELRAAAELPKVLREIDEPVLVDSLGTWVSSTPELDVDTAGLCSALEERLEQRLPTVIVSEEVGLAVHPPTELGRRFVDVMGELNQAVAEMADVVQFVVAGRVMPLGRSW